MNKEEDYTDGGGWSKFDITAAVELSRIISGFSSAKQAQYTTMLLVLYASINKYGYVTMGYRSLAKIADVSDDQARYFLSKLEEKGILVKGEGIGNSNPSRPNRCFYWHTQENTRKIRGREKIPSPRGKNPREIPSPRGKIPREIPAQQSIQNIQNTLGGGYAAAPPPPDTEENNSDNPWYAPAYRL